MAKRLNPNQISIYFTDEDRENADRMFAELRRRGIELKNNKGEDSYSKLFRWFIERELQHSKNGGS